ncbi:class C sortase [Arthrobacter sp. KNU40]|uniref:class C sortase n=1 Tax=Arthrobacter sp. KNU40 TaxID=3447965 RepID=UPI003F63E2C0
MNARFRRPWRPGFLTLLIALLAFGGIGILLYPTTASWVTSYNQSKLIRDFTSLVDKAEPDAATQLAQASRYNRALTAGVEVRANTNVPSGDGNLSGEGFHYSKILAADGEGLMARLKIPAIDVDLPLYHGTSDATLLKGAGHLEGSHFPIGGQGTHSVIAAHRGLASATMFSNLDHVQVGDTFTIEVFGEVLAYQVRETKVVQPEDTDTLRATQGKDLVTLITCTPLGINSQRILVTAERITPTPKKDILAAGKAPEIPGFPWWIVAFGGGSVLISLFVWRAGYSDARQRTLRTGKSEVAEGRLKASVRLH